MSHQSSHFVTHHWRIRPSTFQQLSSSKRGCFAAPWCSLWPESNLRRASSSSDAKATYAVDVILAPTTFIPFEFIPASRPPKTILESSVPTTMLLHYKVLVVVALLFRFPHVLPLFCVHRPDILFDLNLREWAVTSKCICKRPL